MTKTTREARDAAIARILALPLSEREAASKAEARKLRVALRYMKRIVTEEEKRLGRGSPGSDVEIPLTRTEEDDHSPLFELDGDGEREPSPDLERARRSAGLGVTSEEEPEGGPTPAGAGSPGPAPSPTPRAIVSMASYIHEQTLWLYVSVLKLDPSDAAVQRAVKMSEEQKASLEEFAPYVANYFPALLGDDSKIGAIAFALAFGLGSWNAMAQLRAIRKLEDARPVYAEPQPRRNSPPEPQGESRLGAIY